MTEGSKKTGRLVISGILLILAGFSMMNNGAWALHANGAIQTTVKGTLLFSNNNLDVWGWIYLISGFLVAIAGIGVFFRAGWALLLGVAAAFTSMLIQFLWLFTPYWPAAVVTILLDGVVLWALGSQIGQEDPVM